MKQHQMRSESVRVTFDRHTHMRLKLIAHREHKSLTQLVRELAEARAKPISIYRPIKQMRH